MRVTSVLFTLGLALARRWRRRAARRRMATPRGILSAPPRGRSSAADGAPRGILSAADGPPRGVVGGGGMKILPSAKSATPSRIAGEDGKAKQPPAGRAEPELVVHKLLNANLELSSEELQRHLADQSDFTVIGVLGCQGAGKSTVMSLLAGADWRSDEREPGRLRDPPFAPQTLETLLQGSHQTVGVDVTVTQEQLIPLEPEADPDPEPEPEAHPEPCPNPHAGAAHPPRHAATPQPERADRADAQGEPAVTRTRTRTLTLTLTPTLTLTLAVTLIAT